ncbi:hypothetical protein F2Q69_00005230, partial [Brassica cretica]
MRGLLHLIQQLKQEASHLITKIELLEFQKRLSCLVGEAKSKGETIVRRERSVTSN